MTTMHARIIGLLAALSACTAGSPGANSRAEQAPEPAVEPKPPAVEARAEPPAAPEVPEVPEVPETPGALEIVSGQTLRKPTSFEPGRNGNGMSDEPSAIGWSTRTGEFSFCADDGGAVCRRCEFHRPGAETERMESGEECERPARRGAMQARLEDGGFAVVDGEWAYGGQVVLVLSELQGKADASGIRRGVVELGARLRDGDAKVGRLEQIQECEGDGDDSYCAPDVHVDAIAAAPDGRSIAVLLHTFAGEYSDTYPLRMLDAAHVAAEAYNAEGLARLAAQDFEGAGQHFERAAAIEPQAWKAPYNLACARARAGEPDLARAALEQAIARGGDSVRTKAAKDPDLDSVRAEPWFGAL